MMEEATKDWEKAILFYCNSFLMIVLQMDQLTKEGVEKKNL